MTCKSFATVKFDLWPSASRLSGVVLKCSYISLIIGSRSSKCENNLLEVMACEFFASVKFNR